MVVAGARSNAMPHDEKNGPDRPRCLRWLVVLALAALVTRGAWLAIDGDRLSGDPDAYRAIAEVLATHGVIGRTGPENRVAPTAFRPPVYPLCLAALVSADRVPPRRIAALHLVCGLLTVLATYGLGCRWNLRGPALVAGLLTVADPLLLYQSSLVMTETLATLLAVASLLVLDAHRTSGRWQFALAAGLVLGTAALCRPVFLVFAACVAFTYLVIDRRCVAGAILVCGLAIVILPWIARNQIQFGKPIATTTHGGYTLLLGNNASFYAYLRDRERRTVWEASELEPLLPEIESPSPIARELEFDRACYERAWQSIRAEPGMFVRASVDRVGQFWSVLPHATRDRATPAASVLRWLVAVWYSGLILLAVVGVSTCGGRALWQKWRWGLMLCVVMTAVHAVYWSNMRMRAPLVPCLSLLAAAGLHAIGSRLSSRKQKSLLDLE